MFVVTNKDRKGLKRVLCHYPWTDKKDQPIVYKDREEASLGVNWLKEVLPKKLHDSIQIESYSVQELKL